MIKVLIVENERLFRESFKKKLNKYKDIEIVSTAANGFEGLVEIAKYMPDIVFTDIRMPGFDGIQLLEEISMKYHKEIKVILISGYSDFEYTKRAIQLGAFDYLTKPILEEELTELIFRIRNLFPNKLKEAHSNERNVIEAAQSWMEYNIKESSLSKVAAYVRMNPSSFSRKFKEETGVTFIQYLTDQRITLSKKLLKDPRIKIGEISSTIGYSDYQHFRKKFKEETGLSPEEYRKNIEMQN